MWHSYWCLPEPHKQVLPLRNVLIYWTRFGSVIVLVLGWENPWTTLYLRIFTWVILNLRETPSLSVHSLELRSYLSCMLDHKLYVLFSHFFPNGCSSGNNRLIWLLQSTEKPNVIVKLVYGSCGKLNPDGRLWNMWTVNQICSCFSLYPGTLVSISEC